MGGGGLVAVALFLLLLAPTAGAQEGVVLQAERGGAARADLSIGTDSVASLSAQPPAPIRVDFVPATGGPGDWISEMTVRPGTAADGDYRFEVRIESEGGAVATIDVSLRVGAGGPDPAPATVTVSGEEDGPSLRPLVTAGLILAAVALVVGLLAIWQARPFVGKVTIPQRPVKTVPRSRRATPGPRPSEDNRRGDR